MILSSKPSRWVSPLGTICGSKLLLRSRGTSISTAPSSVSTVCAIGAIAVVAAAAASRIALLVAEMVRQLGTQGSLEQSLLELLEQPFLAQQVFWLLVAGQKLVTMFRLDCHREYPASGYPRIAPTQSS